MSPGVVFKMGLYSRGYGKSMEFMKGLVYDISIQIFKTFGLKLLKDVMLASRCSNLGRNYQRIIATRSLFNFGLKIV